MEVASALFSIQELALVAKIHNMFLRYDSDRDGRIGKGEVRAIYRDFEVRVPRPRQRSRRVDSVGAPVTCRAPFAHGERSKLQSSQLTEGSGKESVCVCERVGERSPEAD